MKTKTKKKETPRRFCNRLADPTRQGQQFLETALKINPRQPFRPRVIPFHYSALNYSAKPVCSILKL